MEGQTLLLPIRRHDSTVIASRFVGLTVLEMSGAEVQACQHLIMARMLRTDTSWNGKTHVQLAFRIINGCSQSSSTLPNLPRPPLYSALLLTPSVQLLTTISTAPSSAPPSIMPLSTTLPHRLLIHLILTQRARILSILHATTAVDRARH